MDHPLLCHVKYGIVKQVYIICLIKICCGKYVQTVELRIVKTTRQSVKKYLFDSLFLTFHAGVRMLLYNPRILGGISSEEEGKGAK